MGIEYVHDVTVVTVIADWTIEMVKRGLPDKRPAASDRHARCHADLSRRIARAEVNPATRLASRIYFFPHFTRRDNVRRCSPSIIVTPAGRRAQCAVRSFVRVRSPRICALARALLTLSTRASAGISKVALC